VTSLCNAAENSDQPELLQQMVEDGKSRRLCAYGCVFSGSHTANTPQCGLAPIDFTVVVPRTSKQLKKHMLRTGCKWNFSKPSTIHSFSC